MKLNCYIEQERHLEAMHHKNFAVHQLPKAFCIGLCIRKHQFSSRKSRTHASIYKLECFLDEKESCGFNSGITTGWKL